MVALPSRSALTSFIPIPPVDGKKLAELIGYEAQQNIPLPIDEVIWGSHVSGDTDDGEKEVGIFAVRSEEVSDILIDFSQVGHEIDVLTLGNVGLLNLIRFDLRPTRPIVALEIGSDHTDLIVVNGPRFWFRSLPIAGKDFTAALEERFGCTQEEAENLKVTAARSEHAAKIFQVLQPLLRDLVSEINRSIGYYKSRVGEVKIEDLFLYGGSSKLGRPAQVPRRKTCGFGSRWPRASIESEFLRTRVPLDFSKTWRCTVRPSERASRHSDWAKST